MEYHSDILALWLQLASASDVDVSSAADGASTISASLWFQ